MSVPFVYILSQRLWRCVSYTRWDPKTRAGAVAVRATGMKAVGELSSHVTDWARYQNLSGEHDVVETSPITGPYDWRSYIQEEAQLARRREAKEKPREKKAEIPATSAAPTVFYA